MKNSKVILGTILTAGAVALTGAAHANTELGSTNNMLQVKASKVISEQVKNVHVDYANMDWANDPLQTVCGINCYCDA